MIVSKEEEHMIAHLLCMMYELKILAEDSELMNTGVHDTCRRLFRGKYE